jgi:hypothetical protein
MFVALLVAQVRGRLHVVVAVTSAAVSVGLAYAGAGQWNVILATVFAATLGTVLSGRGGGPVVSQCKSAEPAAGPAGTASAVQTRGAARDCAEHMSASEE